MARRHGGSVKYDILCVQSNLASLYDNLGRSESASRLRRDVYSGLLKLNGEESIETLQRPKITRCPLLIGSAWKKPRRCCRTVPVAVLLLGENHDLTLRMRATYARALYDDPNATLDNLREPCRRSRTRSGLRAACSVARTGRPTWIGKICKPRDPRLALRTAPNKAPVFAIPGRALPLRLLLRRVGRPDMCAAPCAAPRHRP